MSFTRRQMLGSTAAAAAATTVGGCDIGSRTQRIASYCRLCTVHCRIEATVQDDRVIRIKGRRDRRTRGFVCGSGLAIPELLASPRRVLEPTLRTDGEARTTSWEDAYTHVADKIREVQERWGPEAVGVQSGWGLVRRGTGGWLHRLCDAIGTPNYASSSSICVAAAMLSDHLVYGRAVSPDIHHANLCVLWGSNPMHSSPPIANLIRERQKAGMRLVVVDPFRTRLAQTADLHLQLRPGTDLDLALGVLGELFRSGAVDHQTLAETSVGADEMQAVVEPLSPEWTAERTGVDSEHVRELARELREAEAACGITGLAVEQQANGVDACRAIGSLWVVTGNVGKPGGMKLMGGDGTEAARAARSLEPTPPPLDIKPIGASQHPAFGEVFDEAQGNLLADAILDDKPYPLRALIVWGANPLLTVPNSKRVRTAFEKLELLVVVDPMMNETAEMADVVLPAATFMEREEWVRLHDLGRVYAAVPPPGEVRSDWQIIRGLAEALDVGHFFPWAIEDKARRAQLKVLRSKQGKTPTQKFELASTVLRELGLPAVPTPGPAQDSDALILIAGRRESSFINSQLRGIGKVDVRHPGPRIEISPATANERGLSPGDEVWVETETGRIKGQLAVRDDALPGVVRIPHGAASMNVNELTSVAGRDPVSGIPNLRACPCRLVAV